jgi:catechol 2,3-dioxygenase-like lactoylglutathione lyase family enzyme
MPSAKPPEMTLRLELFVKDMPASIDFYSRVLGFELCEEPKGAYIPLRKGEVLIGLNLRLNLPQDHPIQSRANERIGRGVEIVLEVSDINAVYQHVLAEGWPIAGKLQRQPWGLSDFRLLDPDGYYLRLTSR